MARRSTPHLAIRLAAASALALVLAGCKDDSARIDAPEPASLARLAAIDDLPAAEPAPIGDYAPARGYPLAERAYGLQQAVYDAPPDYGFAYEDEESYVWETADDWSMFAEPWDDGYRYYYYAPGAAYPYFVRDRSYGYGYDTGGVLVAVFDSGGRYLPRDYAYRVSPAAGRYYVRGHALWQARRAAPRVEVTERVWAVRAPRVVRTADPWLRAAREQRDWRDWRDRDQARELRRFEGEQRRRQASAARALERRPVDRVEARADVREDRGRAGAEREQRAQAVRQAALEQRRVAEQAREAQRLRAAENDRRQAEQQAHVRRERAQAQHAQAENRRQAKPQAQNARREQQPAHRAAVPRAEPHQEARQEAARADRARVQAQAQAQAQAAQQQVHAQQQRIRAAEQAQARVVREQARAADQAARAAAGREGAKPERPAADKAAADKGDKPHGKGRDRKD